MHHAGTPGRHCVCTVTSRSTVDKFDSAFADVVNQLEVSAAATVMKVSSDDIAQTERYYALSLLYSCKSKISTTVPLLSRHSCFTEVARFWKSILVKLMKLTNQEIFRRP